MSKNYGNDSQIAEIVKYISDTMKLPLIGAGGGFAPLGMYGFSCDYVLTPPQGWLFADGSIYNIADYPEYAALLASQHGRANIYGGDGVTTFATKDLRAEFIRGWGQNSHANQGDGGEIGEHQDATEHVELGVASGGALYTGTRSGGGQQVVSNKWDSAIEKGSSAGGLQPFVNTASGNGTNRSHYTSRPTNTSVAFLVKVTLSDAELNAFNVYTPREHQVAWWEEEIDGVWKRKPVYERTISTTTPSTADTATPVADISSWNLDMVAKVELSLHYNKNNNSNYLDVINQGLDKGNFVSWEVITNQHTLNLTAGQWRTSIPVKIIIQYTKTTDDWQTS